MTSLCPCYVPCEEELEVITIEDDSNPISVRFTESELQCAIQSAKNSSPGIDKIPFQVFKNIPKVGSLFMLNFFNSILNGANIPNEWSLINVVPIPKHGKDQSKKEGYRPIALLNCCRKLLEK